MTICMHLCEILKLTMARTGSIHVFSLQSAQLFFSHYLSSMGFVKPRLIRITVGKQQGEKIEVCVCGAEVLLQLQWIWIAVEFPAFLFLPDRICMPPCDLINPFLADGAPRKVSHYACLLCLGSQGRPWRLGDQQLVYIWMNTTSIIYYCFKVREPPPLLSMHA